MSESADTYAFLSKNLTKLLVKQDIRFLLTRLANNIRSPRSGFGYDALVTILVNLDLREMSESAFLHSTEFSVFESNLLESRMLFGI